MNIGLIWEQIPHDIDVTIQSRFMQSGLYSYLSAGIDEPNLQHHTRLPFPIFQVWHCPTFLYHCELASVRTLSNQTNGGVHQTVMS